MNPPPPSQRADKWLHHVRIFKTRSLAAQACGRSQVTLAGQPVKASRDLRAGDVLEIVRGDLRLRYEVLGFPPRRLSAPDVPAHARNLTPPEWLEQVAERRRQRALETPPAHETLTKPNKQQLRQLREWREQNEAR